MPETVKRVVDPVYDSVGDTGKWQILILVLISLSRYPVAWHQLSTIFLAPPTKFYCGDPGNETDACSSDCAEVVYDRSVFNQTIIMEWDLICDKRHFPNIDQMFFMFGILVGNVSFGIWADKQGRRIPMLFSISLQLVSGVLAAVSPWYWLFVVLRFLCGIGTGGIMLTSFSVIMEIIGPSHREFLVEITYHIPFKLGHLFVPVFAYFIRDFRWYQFSLSIYSVVLLSYFFLIPESPRWLILAGRADEAVKMLEKAAIMNNRPIENIRRDVEEAVRVRASKEEVKKGNVLDLLKTPNLRRNTLCMFFNWYAVGFNFYGVSKYMGHLSGSIFLNVAVSALFSIPAAIMAPAATKYFGRKPTLTIANMIVGITMVAFIFVPERLHILQVTLSSLSVFGAAMCFSACYLYSAELFPTVARSSGMGVASMIARFGAMSSAHATSFAVYGVWVPPLFFATIGFTGMFLTLMLPETRGQPMPETIEDAENYGKRIE